jgi:putative nucleotidyltransferase with HDIG domain
MSALPQSSSPSRAAPSRAELELARHVGEAIVKAIAEDRVRFPPFPAVALQLREVLKRENYGIDQLAEIVEKDQALVAAVMKAANSAFYGTGAKVNSLRAAVSRIGAVQLGRVVIAASLGGSVTGASGLMPVRAAVWRDSLMSAHLCQTLARARGIDGDAAFLSGMLHDFGAAMALACADDFLSAWPDPTPYPAAFWVGIVGAHHVKLGVMLAERWGLDEALRESIALHHEPIHEGSSPLVRLVAASDTIIGFLGTEQAPASEDFANLPGVGGLREGRLIATTIDDILAAVASFELAANAPSRPRACSCPRRRLLVRLGRPTSS